MSEHDHGSGWAMVDPASFITLLLSVETLEQALAHLAQVAVAVIPDGPSCGITVIRDGKPVTAVYAGSIPETVHDDQYRRGDGPCLEAARTGEVVVVQDLAAETRWDGFPAAAVAGGARGCTPTRSPSAARGPGRWPCTPTSRACSRLRCSVSRRSSPSPPRCCSTA
jgi:hypothetical protein